VTTAPDPAPAGAGTRRDHPHTPRLSVAAVARRLGVAPATLRTWDRRYGLGPAQHTPGAHRRYAPADLARLERMQRALLQGATPAEAARLAAAPPAEPARSSENRPEARVVPTDRWALGMGRAATALDTAAVRGLLGEAAAAVGLVRTWDEVVRPVLGAVADRWACTGEGVEIEHLLSEAVIGVFGARAPAAGPPADVRPVLLASMPGELHHLPLTALAAVLAERGVPVRPLGPNLPSEALAAAVRRTAPAAIVLWAQDAATADPGVLAGLPRTRPRFRSFTAGPGWADAAVPDRVHPLVSLADAADRLGTLLGVTQEH
jgi:DNA-binding transcriptional MerR regulator